MEDVEDVVMTDWLIFDEHGRLQGSIMARDEKEAVDLWARQFGGGNDEGFVAVPPEEAL